MSTVIVKFFPEPEILEFLHQGPKFPNSSNDLFVKTMCPFTRHLTLCEEFPYICSWLIVFLLAFPKLLSNFFGTKKNSRFCSKVLNFSDLFALRRVVCGLLCFTNMTKVTVNFFTKPETFEALHQSEFP